MCLTEVVVDLCGLCQFVSGGRNGCAVLTLQREGDRLLKLLQFLSEREIPLWRDTRTRHSSDVRSSTSVKYLIVVFGQTTQFGQRILISEFRRRVYLHVDTRGCCGPPHFPFAQPQAPLQLKENFSYDYTQHQSPAAIHIPLLELRSPDSIYSKIYGDITRIC